MPIAQSCNVSDNKAPNRGPFLFVGYCMKRGIFRVEADSKDITEIIKDRFLDLTITDAAGKDSDTFSLSLDNRDDKLAFPATGFVVRVWLGLEGGLVDKGSYTVDEITEGLEGGILDISGKATAMTGGLKAQKTRTWEAPLLLGKFVQDIASEHGYSCAVHPDLSNVDVGHQNQKAESDMNLLTRICEAKGALMKAGGGHLLVVPRDASEAATGAPLPVIVIDDPSESSGRVTLQERGTYAAVKASYFDAATQSLKWVTAKGDGSGETLELKGQFKDEEEALSKAKSKLADAKRGKATMSLIRPLTPEIVSPGHVRVVNHRQSANGLWSVESATHHVGQQGVSSTSLNLATIEHEASKRKG